MPTSNEKVLRAQGKLVNWSGLVQQLDGLRVLVATGSSSSIRSKVQEIIPEYSFVSQADVVPHRIPRTLAAAAGASHIEVVPWNPESFSDGASRGSECD